MANYFYCEVLKTKRSFTQKLLWIAPLATMLLAFLMGGTYNLQPMSFYWWYAFVLCGFIAILCGLSIQREQRAGKFYSIYSSPIMLTEFWKSKVVAVSVFVVGASLLLAWLMILTILFESVPHVISTFRMLLGAIGVAVSSLWQIPLCLWLANKAGMFLPLLVNAIAGLFSTFITNTAYWWVVPYTWTAKIMEPLTGIKSSGEMGIVADYNTALIPIIFCLSVALFLVLTVITSKWFASQEVK
ncbi:lantibiotic immunity ABC transporter MutE/EpiE family permease subunit [Lachnospiraceae bacterium ZAX-1]